MAFGNELDTYRPDNASAPASIDTRIGSDISPEVAREIAQVQSQMVIAKKFPRDEALVQQKISGMCSRLGLASSACYVYSRGGTQIKGPSIRLAEAVAKAYGNIKCGIEEISQGNGESKVRAYAIDLETNMQEEKIFTVKHIRDTKKGSYALTDQRDIYERVANDGSRRLRACILSIVPSDIVDYAVECCNRTLKEKIKITPETPGRFENSFKRFGVNKDMLEAFIQRKLESMTVENYIRLQAIFYSLKDGVAKPEDFFDMTLSDQGKAAAATAKQIAEENQKKAQKAQAETVKEEPVGNGPGPESFADDSSTLGFNPANGEIIEEDEDDDISADDISAMLGGGV